MSLSLSLHPSPSWRNVLTHIWLISIPKSHLCRGPSDPSVYGKDEEEGSVRMFQPLYLQATSRLWASPICFMSWGGQNLFGEQRPISCTIKLVPLWHWHMEGEKFCGLGRISNDVAWHRYKLLRLMYLNVDKTLYTHMDSRGHSSCQEADRTILKALSIPEQVDCDRTWPDHVRHTPKSGTTNYEYNYWTNLESMVTKQRPWCIVQGTQDNIWHLHSPQIPTASHVSAENTWIRQ